METIPASLPALTAPLPHHVESQTPAPAGSGSMTDAEYGTLIAALAVASRVFTRHPGALSPGDLRTRSLVRIGEKEAKRALLETISRNHRQETAVVTDKTGALKSGRPRNHWAA